MTDPGHPPRPLARSLAELEAELRRVVDRLHTLSEARLAPVRLDARSLAQMLADAAAGIESRDRGTPPAPRAVPVLDDRALGDQVAVTGTDLLLAARGLPGGTPVWAGRRRTVVEEAVGDAVDALARLRRA